MLRAVSAACTAVLDDELYAHVVVVGGVDHHGGGGDIGDGTDAHDTHTDGVVVEVLIAVALGDGGEVHGSHGGAELGVEGVVECFARGEGMAEELDDIHFLVEAVVAHGVGERGVGDGCLTHVADGDGDGYGVAANDLLGRINEGREGYVAAKG